MSGKGRATVFDPEAMSESHTPATGEQPTNEGTISNDTQAALETSSNQAPEVPKQRIKYKLILQNESNNEVIHQAKFNAAGSKEVARYLRRVAANLAMSDE